MIVDVSIAETMQELARDIPPWRGGACRGRSGPFDVRNGRSGGRLIIAAGSPTPLVRRVATTE
jgi:hypothetical protein